ncbi:hypothetical protein CVM39_07830 [Pseudooceanicola antarcticus]|uniref:Uncharacterized protein n=1 Tax=Pseudooceanicola antarcticus TaxID=1247613 RepID=A0ABX4MPW6_9RHOB|nr:hypothetical protein CVM39_07830 [Pseudooceanicola antarcticus]
MEPHRESSCLSTMQDASGGSIWGLVMQQVVKSGRPTFAMESVHALLAEVGRSNWHCLSVITRLKILRGGLRRRRGQSPHPG